MLYSRSMEPRSRLPRALFWTLRLSLVPLGGLLLFVFREQAIAFAEDALGLQFRYVDMAVHLLGTWQSRAILIAVFSAATVLIFAWANRATSVTAGLVLPCGLLFVLVTMCYRAAGRGRPWFWAVPLVSLVAVNALSGRMLARLFSNEKIRSVIRAILVALPGSEVFFPRLFVAFFVGEWTAENCRIRTGWNLASRALAALLPAALWCSLFSYRLLVPLERRLFADPAVKIFTVNGEDFLEDLDLNDIKLDKAANQILVAGVKSSRILAINLAAHAQTKEYAPTGWTEFFNFQAARHELILYDKKELQLKILDTDTLQLKRSIPLELAWGGSWVVYDTAKKRAAVGTEAALAGRPGAVVDMESGKEIAVLPFAPGYMIKHPEKPLVYVSFFWRENRVLRYDLDALQMDRSIISPPRLDRIDFDLKRGEILVAAPLRSALLRYDAETLAEKGTIGTVFGVRTHAVDAKHDVVVTGSLLTNQLEVVDLATHERLARYRLGPHLRSIALDTERGIAYVSSRFGLFEVSYLDRLPERYRAAGATK